MALDFTAEIPLASDLTVLDFSVNCRPSDLTVAISLASDLTILDFWVNCRPSDLTAGKASDKTLSPGNVVCGCKSEVPPARRNLLPCGVDVSQLTPCETQRHWA
eukprot:SAG31_NODE_1524_length_8006_cov_11.768812_1_plen_104_part_00